MTARPEPEAASVVQSPAASWGEKFCFPFLLESRNPDGGWGYRPGAQSSVEPTCWALLALPGVPAPNEIRDAAQKGIDWLCATQLADGSWPAFPAQEQGCWVTSLGCLALHSHSAEPEAVARGLVWLCDSWPGEGGFWWRLREWLHDAQAVSRQNSSYRGWSWTPGTSSWVEPTAHALILLHKVGEELHPPRAARRRQLAELMLFDRMCPGGGWNSGNPLVYGVPGDPLVGPTAWALLALQAYASRAEIRLSLDWLEGTYPHVQSPGSLVLASLCLQIYGRLVPALEPALQRFYAANQFLQNVPVLAWTAIALSPARDCFRWAPARGVGL